MMRTKHGRAIMAMLMAVAMILSSLLPSMEAMAAELAGADITDELELLSTILYSEKYYVENNPDVFVAFGNNSVLLKQHWEKYGIPEGRQYLSPILDVRAYRAANADLERAFGDDWMKYFLHYKNYGAKEIALGQRSPKGQIFDPVKYLDAHPDLRREVGDNNLLAAMVHYLSSGMPIGNWVNARYTAGPAVASQSSSTGTDNSSSSASNDAGYNGSNNGNSGNSGGNGGGSNKPNPTPGKPEPKPPVIDPDDPNKPDEPVQPVHSKDSAHVKEDFGDNGECVQGCGLTLAEFQQLCKMDHSAIEIGHYCLVCGVAGSYDPSEEHTSTSLHTKNSFGEDGLCLRGCGLTIAEFQEACTENHEVLHIGQSCTNCNYQGTVPYDKDVCPNATNHTYGEGCSFCNYAGECLEDHGAIYDTKDCPVCGERGTRVCDVNHSEIFEGVFCKECGVEGTKPVPEVCENEANHDALHKGQNCPGCGTEGTADHTWDKVTGECTGCDTKCSNLSNHNDILQGETCEICGYEGTRVELVVHPEGYAHKLSDFVGGKCGICGMTVDDFQAACTSDEHESLKATGGVCSVCGKQIEKEEFVCPKAEDHVNLHKGISCTGEGCDYVGEADHTFVDGACECGEKDPNYKAPCTEADHAALACGEGCPNCDYVAPNHTYESGVCTRCNSDCPDTDGHAEILQGETCGTCGIAGTKEPAEEQECSEQTHAALACGAKCPNCDYTAPDHAYENGVCTRCNNDCPNDHTDVACGEQCGVCMWVAPGHSYVNSETAGHCVRCGQECAHAFSNGTCGHCGMSDPDYCGNRFHDYCSSEGTCPDCGKATKPDHVFVEGSATCNDCDAPNPNYVEPTEQHVHIWSGGICSGEGECSGCSNAGGHGNIPATGTCDECGAAGTKPVYAHTPDDGHEHSFVDNYCTECGTAKIGFGESEEEINLTDDNNAGTDPTKDGTTGSNAGGGNADDADGTDEQGLPDALPVDIVVIDDYKDDTEPEPEPEGEGGDELEGGGKPEGDEEEPEEGGEEDPEEGSEGISEG